MLSQFSSRWVFCCLQNFSEDEVPSIKSFDLHFLVIVPGHCSFVLFHSLLSFVSNFVDQVQIAINFFFILLFFISLQPNARQPYFHWYDDLRQKSAWMVFLLLAPLSSSCMPIGHLVVLLAMYPLPAQAEFW